MTNSIAWLLLFLASANSTLGNLLLKKSSTPGEGLFAIVFNPYFMAGLAFYGVNVLLFAKALEVLPVSIAYPVLAGVGFLLLILASNILLNEVLSLYQGLGVLLILTGVILLAKG